MELRVRRKYDGMEFIVWKYLRDDHGMEHVWINEWYGHHVIGDDVEWVSRIKNNRFGFFKR